MATRFRLVLFVLVAALSVAIGFVVFRGELAVNLFRYTVYWFLVVAFAGWLVVVGRLFQEWRVTSEARRRGMWLWFGMSLGLTIWVVCFHQEIGLKIVADETLQISTAKNLFEQHEAAIINRGYDLGKGFEILQATVDKRPVFYAWLVSLVHALTGYRWENAMYLNRALALVLAGWLFFLGRRLGGNPGGLLLGMLMLLPPMQATVANSGGFELLNLLMMAVVWHGLVLLMEKPDEPLRFSYLALSTALLANCRYESVLFVLPVAIAMVWAWRRARTMTISWGLVFAPLFFVPRAWLQNVFSEEKTWQLFSKPEAEGMPFGIRFIYDNVGHALNYYFSGESTSMNSVALSAVGFTAVGFWLILLYRRYREFRTSRPDMLGHYLAWLGLGLHLLLMLLYFWGQFDDLTTQRLALPSHLFLSLAVVGVLGTLAWWRRLCRWVLVSVGVLLVCLTIPELSLRRFDQVNYAARAHNWVLRYVDSHPRTHRLVIDRYSTPAWLVTGTSALSQELIRKFPERIRFHWENHTFDEVLCFQRMQLDPEHAKWLPLREDDLGPDFDLEPLEFVWMSPVYGLRLSRVIDIRNEHPEWEQQASHEPGREMEGEPAYMRQWAGKLP